MSDPLASSLGTLHALERTSAHDPLGAIWRATTSAGEPAEVLVLGEAVTRRLTSTRAFTDAVQRAAHLAHPAIVTPLGTGELPDGGAWVVTPGTAGLTRARARLEAAGPLPAPAVAAIGAAAADALAAAHAEGLAHGALSPDTLLLDGDAPRLTRLGWRDALVAGGVPAADAATLLGAAAHAPPELASRPTADARGDVYALGATLYELLTGKPPFGGRTTSYMIAAVLADEDAPPPSTTTEAAGQVTETILRAIEKRPEDRWPSAAAFARALRGERSGSQGVVTTRRPHVHWIAVAILVLLGIAAAVRLLR